MIKSHINLFSILDDMDSSQKDTKESKGGKENIGMFAEKSIQFFRLSMPDITKSKENDGGKCRLKAKREVLCWEEAGKQIANNGEEKEEKYDKAFTG